MAMFSDEYNKYMDSIKFSDGFENKLCDIIVTADPTESSLNNKSRSGGIYAVVAMCALFLVLILYARLAGNVVSHDNVPVDLPQNHEEIIWTISDAGLFVDAGKYLYIENYAQYIENASDCMIYVVSITEKKMYQPSAIDKHIRYDITKTGHYAIIAVNSEGLVIDLTSYCSICTEVPIGKEVIPMI